MSQETAQIPFSEGQTVTAEVGINEEALGMIERGYNESTRCLNFRVSFYRGEGAAAACRIIRAYNDFNGEAVANVLESTPNTSTIDVGREMSPVIYVQTLDGNTRPIIRALDEVHADECEDIGRGTVRAWWD